MARTLTSTTSVVLIALVAAGLSACTPAHDCGSGAPTAIEAVGNLLRKAPAAETMADICDLVESSYTADDADLDELQALASSVGSEPRFAEVDQMGSSIQVAVESSSGEQVHTFWVIQSGDGGWAASIDELAD